MQCEESRIEVQAGSVGVPGESDVGRTGHEGNPGSNNEDAMQQQEQRKLDSLRRVQDFLDAHADAVGALRNSEGRVQLDEAVASLTAHNADQAATDLALAGAKEKQQALASELQSKHMVSIAQFARAKLRGVPDFAALAKSGFGLRLKALIHAARAMATAAAPQRDAFVSAGFPPDAIAELGAVASALEATMTDRANAKVRRVGATKGIEEAVKRGREAVAMLNAVIGRQFAGDATFLAGWRAARRVTAKPGLAKFAAAVLPTAAPVPATA